VAFCMGGWLWQTFGAFGLYGLPIALMILQFVFVLWLQGHARRLPPVGKLQAAHQPEDLAWKQPIPPRRFLQMAWLASPFAYVAINTFGAVIPQLAQKFNLTDAQSGVFNSLWFYVRFAAFVLLWKWTGWHYRFRWLLTAMIGLVTGFATLLLAPQLWLVIVAQVIFGFSIGLIYYSSLFYSMDAGDDKGAHGGVHEAAIGLGIFGGPAVGAAALTYLPHQGNSGTIAVTTVLVAGLMGLLILRWKHQPKSRAVRRQNT
jgi:predicted MFS family arabinose efflux permease